MNNDLKENDESVILFLEFELKDVFSSSGQLYTGNETFRRVNNCLPANLFQDTKIGKLKF